MTSYETLLDKYRDIQAIQAAIGLMHWDRQVLMPAGGTPARTEHVARLAMLEHSLWLSEELRTALDKAASRCSEDSPEAANVRVMKRELEHRSKLPSELVDRKTRIAADSYEAWKKAKAEKNYATLAPFLRELFEIARETSHLLDPDAAHPYDPLIDQYDEGASFAYADRMLSALKGPTKSLLEEIKERGKATDDAGLRGDWNRDTLREFAQEMAAQIGFDFSRGRLDHAPSAFCGGTTLFDVRMTTRASDHIKGVLSSSLHEMGHGLYEQGGRPEWAFMPLAGGSSLAIHESQSRMWENVIGRSRPFWECFFPRLQDRESRLRGLDIDTFWRGMNRVRPEFIRVGADELTYNLHIIVRFELEVELVTRRISVDDLPEAWNSKYTAYLGITPPDDGVGCLQDVHWSRGSCGYFPTYAIGNIISGGVWQALRASIPDIDARIRTGEFAEILEWLQEHIYRQAQLYTPKQLLHRLLGGDADPRDWLAYASAKYSELYAL